MKVRRNRSDRLVVMFNSFSSDRLRVIHDDLFEAGWEELHTDREMSCSFSF